MAQDTNNVDIVVRLLDQVSATGKRITASFTDITKAGESADDAIVKLEKDLKKIDEFKTLKKDTKELKDAWKEAEKTTKALSAALGETGDATERQVKAFNKAKGKAGALKKEYEASSKALKGMQAQLNASGVSTTKLTTETKRLASELRKAQQQSSNFQKGLAAIQKDAVGIAGALGAVGVSLGAPFVKAGTEIASFQDQMIRTKALTQGITEDMFGRMTEQAEELGRTTLFTATQAAEGFKFLAMAGLTAEQQLEALPKVLSLATAGNLDLGRSADIVTNIMTGYAKDVDELTHVADALTFAFTNSNNELGDLGEAFKYVAPIAAGVGADFDEIVGALASLGKAGIRGSLAGTALRGAIDALLSPTKQEAELMAKLAEQMGGTALEIETTEGKFVGFVKIIEQLEAAGITAAEALNLFGLRAGPSMQALITIGSKSLADFTKGVKEDSKGIADAINALVLTSFKSNFETLLSALSGLFISIGNKILPLMVSIVKGITEIVNKLTEWHNAMGPLATVFDVAAISIAAFLVASAGFLGFITLVISPLRKVAKELGLFTKAWEVLKNLRVASILAGGKGALVAFGAAFATPLGQAIALGAAFVSLSLAIVETVNAYNEWQAAQATADQANARLIDQADKLKKKYAEFADVEIPDPVDIFKGSEEALKDMQSKLLKARAFWVGFRNELFVKAKEKTFFGSFTDDAIEAQKQIKEVDERLAGYKTALTDITDVLKAQKPEAVAVFEAPKKVIPATVDEIENLGDELEGFYDEAIEKAKEYGSAQKDIDRELKSSLRDIAARRRELESQKTSEWMQKVGFSDTRIVEAEIERIKKVIREVEGEAQTAIVSADFDNAEKYIQEIDKLYQDLAKSQQKAIDTQGDQLTKRYTSATDVALKGLDVVEDFTKQLATAQKDAAASAEETWKEKAKAIEATLDELLSLKELNIQISPADLTEVQGQIADLTQTEVKTIKVKIETLAAGTPKTSATEVPGFATGGVNVRRGAKIPGFSTVDSFLATLARGETVIKSKSTRAIMDAFPGLLQALNSATSPGSVRSILAQYSNALPGFAAGGVAVGTISPSIMDAAERASGPMTPINLFIGDTKIPVLGSAQALKNIEAGIDQRDKRRTRR